MNTNNHIKKVPSPDTTIWQALKRAYLLLRRQNLRFIILILLLCVLAGILDLIGLGTVLFYLRTAIRGLPGFITTHTGAVSLQDIAIIGGIILTVFILAKNVLSIYANNLLNRYIFNLSHNTTMRFYNHVMAQPYLEFLMQDKLDMAAIIGSDTRRAYLAAAQPLILLIRDVLIVVMIMSLLLLIAPMVTITLIVLASFFLGLNILFLKRVSRRLALQQEESLSDCRKWLNYSLDGFLDIRLAGHNFFAKNYEQATKCDTDAQFDIRAADAIPLAQNEMILTLSIIVIMIYLNITGQDLVELLPIFIIMGFAGLRILSLLSRIFIHLKSISLAAPVVDKVLSFESTLSSETSAETPAVPYPSPFDFKKEITLENITFAYPKTSSSDKSTNPPVLSSVSCTINKGDFVGIVGESGSGKSTLINILLHLINPNEGQIFIDSKPLNTSSERQAFWSNIGYVSQSPVLFPDSIKNNVIYGSNTEEYDEQRVWKALELAQLSDMVKGYDKGLDTVLLGDNASLSGGQKQRLMLARMFYRQADILILDEATSALDNIIESSINDTLAALKQEGKTIICIAHRLSTIQKADNILLLDKGILADQGTFKSLQTTNALFKKLVELGTIDTHK
jgi:ABC-type multidrug transport system fused ATPase/permease subunit